MLAADTFRLGAIAGMLIDPAHSNFVLVCARNGRLLNGGSTGYSIGGVYRSTDGGATWASIGGTLATIQSYHVALHPTDPNILYTSNQDNGTTQRSGNNV